MVHDLSTRDGVLAALKSACTVTELDEAMQASKSFPATREARKEAKKRRGSLSAHAEQPEETENGPLTWSIMLWKRVTRASSQQLPLHLARYFHGHNGAVLARMKTELQDANPGANVQIWLDVSGEKLEVQCEYAAAVDRCTAEFNAFARRAQAALALTPAGADAQRHPRTVPCPPPLALSMPRLLRRLARELGTSVELAHHAATRVVAVLGATPGGADDAADAVARLCETARGAATPAEEAEAERREARAAREAAAAAASAAAAERAAAAHALHAAAAAAAPQPSAASRARAHSTSSNNGGNGGGGTVRQRTRPPLAPLRTDSNDQSGGPASATSVARSADGDDSPRAASVVSVASSTASCSDSVRSTSSASSCASGLSCGSALSSGSSGSSGGGSGGGGERALRRVSSSCSLFSEGSAPWEGMRVSAAAASPSAASWDYYRQAWVGRGDAADLADDLPIKLDLAAISFVPPPRRSHIIAAAARESAVARRQRPAAAAAARGSSGLEPGLERSVWALLVELELTKYAPALSGAEVDMAALRTLGDKDLEEVGLPKGPRVKLLKALRQQQQQQHHQQQQQQHRPHQMQ